MSFADILALVAGELALFAACGLILIAIDDLIVDILYFTRRFWRSATVYRKYPRAFAQSLSPANAPGWIAVFIPAWDESAVIDRMLRSTLERWGQADYRLFVGYYRNDPATAAAIHAVRDPRIIPVLVDADGPTTKADCLNHLHDALLEEELDCGRAAKAVVLHDAEDLVHSLEIALFDKLIERAGAVQLPVIPLVHPNSRWISGHYCDEFAESHGKELVVREAVGASIPLAGVACAVERSALAKLATQFEGRPFSGESQTEDYELGLRLGAMGYRTMFVRIPAIPGDPALVASHGHFPASLDTAVRQKSRWIGGIAFSGWDRLGWRGGWGERWMRMRDRRGPFAALLMLCGYLAAILWSQLWAAEALGAPVSPRLDPLLKTLLIVNGAFLLWRLFMRFAFTARIYGIGEGLLAIPRLLVANAITMLAVKRALGSHLSGGPRRWDKTHNIFPKTRP